MDADTVQALRDAKALFDEGILSEQEFKEKKAELLQPKAAPVAAKPKPKPKPAPKKKSEAKPKAEKKPKKSTASSDGSEKEKKAPRVAELTLQDAFRRRWPERPIEYELGERAQHRPLSTGDAAYRPMRAAASTSPT